MSDYCDGCCKAELDATDKLLLERGNDYGDFALNAKAWEKCQKALKKLPGWSELDPPARLALQMILLKLVRIAGGGKFTEDTLDDIEGYARLITTHSIAR